MSYIQPSTNITICKNVPLDIDYKNTIYFSNATAQNNYFLGKAWVTIPRNTYTRVNNNKVRVEGNAERYYACNYMMFKNAGRVIGATDKWFYAFITNVEYINENVTEITYEIDELQTWFFDMELEDVWVERQHTETDNIGDNLTAESVDLGDYITTVNKESGLFDDYDIFALKAVGEGESYNSRSMLAGIPMGLDVLRFTQDATNGYHSFFTAMEELVQAGKDEEVISVYMFPKALVPQNKEATANSIIIDYPASQMATRPTKIGVNYVPKNNKLFTYPYCFLNVDTGDASMTYKFERFPGIPSFTILASIASTPEAVLVPNDYEGVDGYNFLNSIAITSFPMVAFSVDSYKAWVAQGGLVKTGVSLLGALGSEIFGLASGNPVAVAGGVAMGINSAINFYVKSHTNPDRANGTPTGSAFVGTRELDFHLRVVTVTDEFAKRIDKYFSKYGYAINEVRKPNLHARERYTYIKTIDSHVGGNIPATAERKISEIFDDGITFWSDITNIGKYTDANGNLLANNTL